MEFLFFFSTKVKFIAGNATFDFLVVFRSDCDAKILLIAAFGYCLVPCLLSFTLLFVFILFITVT